MYNSANKLITFTIKSKNEINITENVRIRAVEPLDNCFYFVDSNNVKVESEFSIGKETLKQNVYIATKENCKKKRTVIKFEYVDDNNREEIDTEPVLVDVEVKEQSLITLSADYNIPESVIKFNESYKITVSINQKMTQDNSSCEPITLKYSSTSDILTFEPSSLVFNCNTTATVQDITVQLYSVDVKKNVTDINYDLKSENKLVENLPTKTLLIDTESLNGKGKIKISYKKEKKIKDDTKITFKITKCPIVFGELENLRIRLTPDEDSEGKVELKQEFVEWLSGKDCSNYGLSKDIEIEGKEVGKVKFYVHLEGNAKNKYSYKQSFKIDFYEKKEDNKEIEIGVDDFDDDKLITMKGQKIKLEIDGEPKEDLYIKVKYDKEELVVVPDVIKFEDDEDDDVYFMVYSISDETEHSTISFEVKNNNDFDDDDEDRIEVPDNLKLKICGIRDCTDLSQENDGGSESSVSSEDDDNNDGTVVDRTFVVGVVVLILVLLTILFIYFVF